MEPDPFDCRIPHLRHLSNKEAAAELREQAKRAAEKGKRLTAAAQRAARVCADYTAEANRLDPPPKTEPRPVNPFTGKRRMTGSSILRGLRR